MFSIKLNLSPIEGTLLERRDSLSLYFEEECLSTFSEAVDSTYNKKIAQKIEGLYPYASVDISSNRYGFSTLTLRTLDDITPPISLPIEVPTMDISIDQVGFEERYMLLSKFLGDINNAIKAFEYVVTHTNEQIATKIGELKKEVEFLESLSNFS
jgi:hypothetical protein